ncbi:MAG: hypothetical protein J1F23_06735 [Oscillospiraceae bacterium]|nr:hypothetical protein [Oscillospiraceae bacterium]
MKVLDNLKEKITKAHINKKTALFVVIGLAGMFLILISEMDFSSENDKKNITSDTFSSAQYCDYLERKVEEIVGSIDGAGKTRVMITLSETTEYVYATNDKINRKNSENSADIDSENEYVIIERDKNDSGLLLKTIEPKVKGVAVVCEGGDNAQVQQQIYSAVGAVLSLSTSRISISKLTVTEEK